MSTEYFIFIDSNDISEVLRVMSTVCGVELRGRQLHIDGLLFTEHHELDPVTRKTMREDYGDQGLDVNWRIGGTHDKSHDIFELMMRLFKCAAALIETWPVKNLSLMRNAESFHVINTADELIISNTYMKGIPGLVSVFENLSVIKKVRFCQLERYG